MRQLLLALPSVLVTACCTLPWQAYKMERAPDESCMVGHPESGVDYYIWHCLDGERVVIHQHRGTFVCGKVVRETSACGELTESERVPQPPDAPARQGEISPLCGGEKGIRWGRR